VKQEVDTRRYEKRGIIMTDHELLDLEEWAALRHKLAMYQDNITEEAKAIVKEMMAGFKPEMVTAAAEKSKLGQRVLVAIEDLAKLDVEGGALEEKFQGFVGCPWEELDLDNLDVDFIEDLMLKAKPMNESLADLRSRQMLKFKEVKAEYWEVIKDLGVVEEAPVEEVSEGEQGEEQPAKENIEEEPNPVAA